MSQLSSQIVSVENGINFRDLGGIKTKDGRTIRSGVLFRSGDFAAITPKESSFLAQKLKIKNILDYRDAGEIETRPDNVWFNAKYINVSANPHSKDVTANLAKELTEPNELEKNHPNKFMIKLYQLLPFDNLAYRQLVALLLCNNGQSFVQHCAIGKDRTGIGVALTLFALGVDEEIVMQDYVLSDTFLTPIRDQLLVNYNIDLNPENIDRHQAILAAKPEYLQAALDAIKEKYQTIDNWLEKEYHLTAKNRKQIQDYYLI